MENLTEVLSREHQLILLILDRMERALDEWDEAHLERVVAFFDREMVLHRRKEEDHLFPELAKLFPPQTGPVAVMREEHRLEHDHVERLRQALLAHDRSAGTTAGRGILDHLRDHIAKEDGILFPMAEAALQGEGRRLVAEGFQAVGTFAPKLK